MQEESINKEVIEFFYNYMYNNKILYWDAQTFDEIQNPWVHQKQFSFLWQNERVEKNIVYCVQSTPWINKLQFYTKETITNKTYPRAACSQTGGTIAAQRWWNL